MREGIEVIIDPNPAEKTAMYKGVAKVDGQTYPFELTQISTEAPKHTEMEVWIDYDFKTVEAQKEVEDIIRYHISQHDIW